MKYDEAMQQAIKLREPYPKRSDARFIINEAAQISQDAWSRAYFTGAWDAFSPDAGLTVCTEPSTEAAVEAERTRIRALLETLRPMEQPYTRRDWALEQKGEKAMFEKILRAIAEPVKS